MRIAGWIVALSLSVAVVGGCSRGGPAMSPAADDPYRPMIHAVAAIHDGLIGSAHTPDAAVLLQTGPGGLSALTQAIVAAPAPRTREQRYVLARALAYESAATALIDARSADATSLGQPDSVPSLEQESGLTEAYDLLAAAEKRFLKTAVLWDRLRVKRRGALTIDAAALKRRMKEADDAVASEFEGFD